MIGEEPTVKHDPTPAMLLAGMLTLSKAQLPTMIGPGAFRLLTIEETRDLASAVYTAMEQAR